MKDRIVVPDEELLPLPFGVLITNAEDEEYRHLAELSARAVAPAPSKLSCARNGRQVRLVLQRRTGVRAGAA